MSKIEIPRDVTRGDKWRVQITRGLTTGGGQGNVPTWLQLRALGEKAHGSKRPAWKSEGNSNRNFALVSTPGRWWLDLVGSQLRLRLDPVGDVPPAHCDSTGTGLGLGLKYRLDPVGHVPRAHCDSFQALLLSTGTRLELRLQYK